MPTRTAFDAALRLRDLDDTRSMGANSLAIAFGGGHGAHQALKTLTDVRTLVAEVLRDEDKPKSPFGDAA